MKFCSECGNRVEKRVIGHDPQLRFQCTHCGKVHYQNPKVLVSCHATWEDKVLWMRRGTEPFKGLWTAPSGFVEEDESLLEATARELYEETRAKVDMSRMNLWLVGNLMPMNQIYMVYHAPLLSPDFETTEEATEVALFNHKEFPREEFAFPEVLENVDLFYEDLLSNNFRVFMGKIQGGTNTIATVAQHL
ncbi:NUDIX hydrolase [Pseudomaricurvus alkylphenolicus]|jgi:ADP-ribose pyrophosphatase YjhB (NUDIX family)|uniref:NUDIX hydrolase n=1 Tax=Pseudomaricurvus alkylphenolicus TaxID=1306991 RepID=UPI00141F589D|nr:NUDIX hydrolase [Pseudomaricurvus alkylphenolicus]NIB42673.1 NUDIX hydrolase [Pseudomaricurvus alkylphenolicus]